MTVYVCDRCGKRISLREAPKIVTLEQIGYAGWKDHYDVCDDCFNWFKDQLHYEEEDNGNIAER